MIVVTGANGQLGRKIIEHLLDLVADASGVTASVTDPGKAADLAARGVSVRRGDFDDPDTLANAFEGADRLLLVPSRAPPDQRIQQHRNVVAAAGKAGVKHFVFMSFVEARLESPLPYARIFTDTELHLRESGMDYTNLRNSHYAENILGYLSDALETGLLRAPAGEGRVTYVTCDDIARSAATVLADGSHAGLTCDLTGPEALSFTEIAGILSDVYGKPVAYQEITPEELRTDCQELGLPDYAIDGAVGMMAAVVMGRFANVSSAVEDITGRPPQAFAEWLAAHKAAEG